MVSTHISGCSDPSSSSGRGRCVLGQTFYSHSATLHPLYKWAPANLMQGTTLRWTSIPLRRGGGGGGSGSEILLVSSCYGNRYKLLPGSYPDFLLGNKKLSNQENISLVLLFGFRSVWRSNMIKQCLVTKHVDVELSDHRPNKRTVLQ